MGGGEGVTAFEEDEGEELRGLKEDERNLGGR